MSSPPPTRIVDPANLQALFFAVMERKQMKSNEIGNKWKEAEVVVHGCGQFECLECRYRWHSHFSWIRIDLKLMLITYRWKMKCRNCLCLLQPTFSLEETERMVEKAICRYRGERYVNPNFDSSDSYRRKEYRQPHLPQLCEKCGWGQVQCWTLPPFARFVK